MSSYSDYANAVSAILVRKGENAAQAAQQRGLIWGNTVANLGSLVGSLPAQYAAQQHAQQQDALERQRIQQQQQVIDRQIQQENRLEAQDKRTAATNAIFGEAVRQNLNPDGTINLDAMQQSMAQHPDFSADWPRLGSALLDYNKKVLESNKARETQERDHIIDIGTKADIPTDVKNKAGLLVTLLAQGVQDRTIPAEAAKRLTYGILDENGVPNEALVTRTIASMRGIAPKETEGFTLGPGQTRFNPAGQQIASVPTAEPKPPTPPAPAPFTLSPGQRRFDANGQPIASVPPNPPATGGGGGAQAGGAVALEPDTIEDAAILYRLKGPSSLPTRFGDDDKKRIMNAATRQRKELGQTGAEVLQGQMMGRADQSAITKMVTAKASAQAFENKALAQVDIINDLSKKVSRTKYPIINAALQSGRTAIAGDTDATQLANAIETFSEEYAKIIAGSTGSAAAATDSTRAASKRLINTAMSKGTMADVLALMQKEMGLTVRGYDVVIKDIQEQIRTAAEGGRPVTPPNPAAPPTGAGLTYQDYLKAKGAVKK